MMRWNGMKKKFGAVLLAGMMGLSVCSGMAPQNTQNAAAASGVYLEKLDRGISAVSTGSGMLVSWRFLANDPDAAIFKLYRDDTLVYTANPGDATCFLDAGGNASSKYKVETYSGTSKLNEATCALTSGGNYFDVKLDKPGSIYSPNDCSVGDVDGDGVYELFVKWDPNNSQDNSKGGVTDKVYIDCYKLNGTKLWRIDLGVNIRAGAHYTQFLVADFDMDGKAEMTCKTADGTVDGTGKVIGNANANYRNSGGYILSGPEYYTLFDGATGAALHTVNYEHPRGEVSKKTWGDDYGNRCDRFLGSVVYLDGVKPSAVSVRGYYTRMTAVAYDVVDKKLVKRWAFDTGYNSSAAGYGNGNHNCMPADVDGDGRQELVLGSTCLDDNGKVLWCTGRGHGDAMHLSDFLPDRPGQELWMCHENPPYGVSLIDAANGNIIFHVDNSKDTGRCAAGNVWSGNKGGEFWGMGRIFDGAGTALSADVPAVNFMIHWDGDLEREILDGGDASPATISDMNASGKISALLTTTGYLTCNSTKATPSLSADIFGDWREELVLRAADGNSLRIFATTYDTDYRITTLMHDAQYRMQVSAQNTSYNQPPNTSFYLGSDANLPNRPNGSVAIGGKIGAKIDTNYLYTIKNVNSGLYLEVADSAAADGTNVQQGTSGARVWKFEDAGDGYYYLYSEVGDGKTYLLDLDSGKPDNGTNIGIWSNTSSDAQLFKFVSNGDGSYTICTKVTTDQSVLGVNGGSKEDGANVLQWESNGENDQKWRLNISGSLFEDLNVTDDTKQYWQIDLETKTNDRIFGDRDFTYISLPAELEGAQSILTGCDAKYNTNDLATFVAAKDATIYIAMDTRVTPLPSWMSGWTQTSMTAASSNEVTFQFYSKEVQAGEKVTLGQNGMSSYCVNYTVFGVEKEVEQPTEPPTEAPTEPPTEATTEAPTQAPTEATTEPTTEAPTQAPTDAKVVYGDVNLDGGVDILDVIVLNKGLLGAANLEEQQKRNADCDKNGKPDANDSLMILKFIVGILDSLDE
ncbi:MAG: RICIN domain-containing protein [Oscillospiraceae bacterium]|nr:RICIN domain-containing protein [Oscillospiraceae bacterium]